jgi:hypothetical protein
MSSSRSIHRGTNYRSSARSGRFFVDRSVPMTEPTAGLVKRVMALDAPPFGRIFPESHGPLWIAGMLKEPFERRQVLAGRGVRYVRVLGYDWSVSGWSVAGGGGGRGGGVACGGSVAMPTDTGTLDRQLHGRDVGGAAVSHLLCSASPAIWSSTDGSSPRRNLTRGAAPIGLDCRSTIIGGEHVEED